MFVLLSGSGEVYARFRSASEGERRAARAAPTPPAMRPPSTARATPTMSVNGWIGAVRWIVDDVMTAWVDWPKRPARLEPWNVDTPTVLADSAGEKALTPAVARKPRARPSAPATRPMPTVSATIWRTTRPRDHPIARRVPISRTRLPTEDSVSSMAITKAAATTMTPSAPPRESASFFTSLREPVTWLASDWVVMTVAPGSPAWMRLATASTSLASFTFTRISVIRPDVPARVWIVESGK